LDHFLNLRQEQADRVGVLLGLEGAHALNGELSNLDKLYELSFRVFGISHFFENEAGGSAHDKEKRGLSAWGRELVQKLQKLHMIIDLSHASGRVLNDVIEMVENPVIVSHTGVCGRCNNSRNLTDDQVKKVASTGGIIGIAMFEKAVCGRTIKDVVQSIRYVFDLVGDDYISVGSDFDGAIAAPIDASGLPLLTKELINEGFDTRQIAKIMGGNALRVFRQILPKSE
jgi:microsomal dipeptidase-like Zn-dependent dipeptidase